MGIAPDAFDYSWARPDPQQMASAGIRVVARYLTGSGKAIDRTERARLHAAGIGIVLNYEMDAGAAFGGKAQGKADGAAARAAAKALGAPKGTPIYYSVDHDVTSQMSAVKAYLKAADSRDYPARCYGEADVLDAFGRPGWQTYAWSGGRMSRHAVLYQYLNGQSFHGSAVDHNTILDSAALGAWWPPGHAPEGGSHRPLEEAMPLSKEDVSAIWDAPGTVRVGRGGGKPWRPSVVLGWLHDQLFDVHASSAAGAKTAADNGRLIAALGKRVAQQQRDADAQAQQQRAAIDALTKQLEAVRQQLADLAAGKITVSGEIPATLKIGG